MRLKWNEVLNSIKRSFYFTVLLTCFYLSITYCGMHLILNKLQETFNSFHKNKSSSQEICLWRASDWTGRAWNHLNLRKFEKKCSGPGPGLILSFYFGLEYWLKFNFRGLLTFCEWFLANFIVLPSIPINIKL